MQLLANSKGHLLKDHLLAVSHIGKEMGISLGLPLEIIADIELAGLLHDFGKATKPFQKYINKVMGCTDEEQLGVSEIVLHHEISWAYLAQKIDREKYSRVLNSIYWHHARPLNEYYEMHENSDDVLKGQNTSPLDSLFKEMGINITERPTEDTIMVPVLFQKDSTGDRNRNAEMLAVRGCLITADRFVSSLETQEVCDLAKNHNVAEAVSNLLAGTINGYTIPQKYDNTRFTIQEECAKKATNHKTIQVNAPAGFGKTIIGLLWGSLQSKKLIWVCPRNVVAQTVYQSILREMDALGLTCSIELYLTGRKQESHRSKNSLDFGSDIVVTNIDNLLSPLINNSVSARLFSIMGGNVVFDEYHEFISDSPLFAAFITLMRVRHRMSNNAKTLLLSATPTNMHLLWDNENKTTVLPAEGSHYPPAHEGAYQIKIGGVPDALAKGSLTVFNSVKNTQGAWESKNATYIAHSRYTDTHRKIIMDTISEMFGKTGTGIIEGKNLVAAPIVQAAMDISFSSLTECICSPETTLQRIGRCDRWGNLRNGFLPIIQLVALNDASERGAISTMYNFALHTKWVEFLQKQLKGKDTITLQEWYCLYNNYYQEASKDIHVYLKDCYTDGLKALAEYYPIKFVGVVTEKRKSLKKSLRNPGGSYFYTVKTTLGDWLGPDDIGSEGKELLQTYLRDGELNNGLLNKSKMKFILKKLVDVGFEGYKKVLNHDWIPNDINRWFWRAKNKNTPLPDISRMYHVLDKGETIESIGKGLIKTQ